MWCKKLRKHFSGHLDQKYLLPVWVSRSFRVNLCFQVNLKLAYYLLVLLADILGLVLVCGSAEHLGLHARLELVSHINLIINKRKVPLSSESVAALSSLSRSN